VPNLAPKKTNNNAACVFFLTKERKGKERKGKEARKEISYLQCLLQFCYLNRISIIIIIISSSSRRRRIGSLNVMVVGN
jgi:hypothetical protein